MFGSSHLERVARGAQSIEDLRDRAASHLPRVMFDFYDGGAEEEWTLRGNREAFTRLRLRPRVLVDVEKVSTQQNLLSLSGILCARHSMTTRSIYANQQDEVEECGDRGEVRGAAQDPPGTA